MKIPKSAKIKRVLFYKREFDARHIRTDVTFKTIAEWFNLSETYVEQICYRMNEADLADIQWPYESFDLKVIDMFVNSIIKSK